VSIIQNPITDPKLNRDMPKYTQYPGACGLTSLLMVLKPQSRSLDTILDKLWDMISERYSIDTNLEKAKNWQVVLEWLLFQTTRNKSIQDSLAEVFGEDFNESMLPVLKDGISSEKPFTWRNNNSTKDNSDWFNNKWLMRRVFVWKQDFELSILLNLFGFVFIPWKYNKDGTGALYFTPKELNNKDAKYNEKIEFLLSRIKEGDPILCCESIHWIAIKNLELKNDDYMVYYHDPATGDENIRPLRGFRESDRFYSFKSNPDLLKKHLDLIKTLFGLYQ
jgi:hypothetical protein